ncbi:hypothetical protein [uncultured Methanobrevibacter sp.]|uniref:hypothetical protein n=1 Tax=uncultured Methanobrevibacter sp. TaxID=253161 RepID=UPI00263929F8|nr:hypothetical protein [uncultured Methanobrevibacter sp.]
MIKVEKIDVWGFEHAIRGMRNPLNSWDKSDSNFFYNEEEYEMDCIIGRNDLDLMRRLFAAGTEHRKYLRQIIVSMDITAPLYWWKEFDTYKVGTVANSCSTMHKIHAKEFTLDDFSWDQLLNNGCDLFELQWGKDCSTKVQPQHFLIQYIIPVLNICREKYLETKDKKYWWQMIQLLPSSYNQKRTVTMNYENVVTIIRQRTGHKLDEWNEFVKVLKDLPYVIYLCEGNKNE